MYKGKAVRDHAMMIYAGRRCVAPLVINLGARQTWEVKFTPWSVFGGKEPSFYMECWKDGIVSRIVALMRRKAVGKGMMLNKMYLVRIVIYLLIKT